MKYIYSKSMCGACIALKKKYDDEGIEYVERDGSRLQKPADNSDEIDREGLVQLAMQNQVFPVEVEM